MKNKRGGQQKTQSGPEVGAPSSGRWRWLLLLLALAVAAGTWAVLELVVWNNLPAALVGKWVVTGGEQDGATFDFYRNGTMLGRINLRGKEGIINATVRVEGSALHSTTTNPNTRSQETRTQTIVKLDGKLLVLEDEQGRRLNLERAE